MKAMGKKEQKLYFLLESKGIKVFDLADLESFGYSKAEANSLLVPMAKKKVISKVRKGVYVRASPKLVYDRLQQVESPILIAAKAAKKDYYIAFCTALEVHGISENITFKFYVATPSQRRNIKYLNYEAKFVEISKHRFFGFGKTKFGNSEILVSDKEKTIVDCVCYPQYSGGIQNIIYAIKKLAENRIDWEKVLEYAIKMKSQALLHRLGYIVEQIYMKKGSGVVPQSVVSGFAKHISSYKYYLEYGKGGKLISKWKLVVPEGVDYGV